MKYRISRSAVIGARSILQGGAFLFALLTLSNESLGANPQVAASRGNGNACFAAPCLSPTLRKDDDNKNSEDNKHSEDNTTKPSNDKHISVDNPNKVVSDPDDNITVDMDGSLVISGKTAKPYHIDKNATENAGIRLPKDKEVEISDDSGTLKYVDRKGNSQLLVKTLGGKKQLEIADGDVEIHSSASGNTIPLLSANGIPLGQIATQTNQDTVRINRSPTQVKFHVDAGKVTYQDAGPTPATSLFRGENIRIGNNASIEKITFGSADGAQKASGDPLPQRPEYAPNTFIPYLNGKLARFSDQLSLLDIVEAAVQEFTGLNSGQLSYDMQSGVVSFVAGRRGYRLIPLGEVRVLLNQLAAASVATTASGAFTLASQGIQITLAGAVGYFDDLQQAVKAIDGAGQVTLRPNGALEFRLNNARFAAQPGIEANLPETPLPAPGFEMSNGGLAMFRDRLGAIQTLYPAFADTDQLAITINQAIPGAGLTAKGDGLYTVSGAGHNYTVMPEYALSNAPANHAADRWWMDNGTVYLRNSDNTVQGLRIR